MEKLVDSESNPGLMGDREVQVDPLVERKLESEPGWQVKREHRLDIADHIINMSSNCTAIEKLNGIRERSSNSNNLPWNPFLW